MIVINQRHGTSAVEIHGQGPSAITSAFQRYKKGKASAFAGALGRGEAKRSDVLLFICAFLVFAKGEANGRSTLHADLFCDPLHAVGYNDGGDGDGE